ncbi:hypothetical protein BJX70DRAFT_384991 [Aspergillus crustosus]
MSIVSIMSSGSSRSSKSNKTQGALRSYLEGLKGSYISNLNNHRASIPSTIRRQAGLTLRLVVQILFEMEITAFLTSAIYKLNSCINKYHDILSSLFLEPFDKICHAIMYAADSFNERGYRVCDEYSNKVDMSA